MVSVRHKDKTRKTIVLGRASSADWKTRCIKAINTIHIFIFDKLCTLPPFIEINSVSALAYPSTGPLKLFSDPALLENAMTLKKLLNISQYLWGTRLTINFETKTVHCCLLKYHWINSKSSITGLNLS